MVALAILPAVLHDIIIDTSSLATDPNTIIVMLGVSPGASHTFFFRLDRDSLGRYDQSNKSLVNLHLIVFRYLNNSKIQRLYPFK